MRYTNESNLAKSFANTFLLLYTKTRTNMNFKLIALSLCMMAAGSTWVQGQNNESGIARTENKHEIRLSVSDGLTIGSAGILGMGLTDAIMGSKRSDQSYSLVYGLGYRYGIKRFRVGADLGFAMNSSKLSLAGESSPSLNEKELKFLILPTAEFIYLKRNLIELYGSAAAGIDLTRHTESPIVSHSRDVANKTDLSAGFAYQINPIALRVGNDRIGGFLEAGLGHKGFLTAGISLRF